MTVSYHLGLEFQANLYRNHISEPQAGENSTIVLALERVGLRYDPSPTLKVGSHIRRGNWPFCMNYKGTVGQDNSGANVYSPWYLGNSNTFQWAVTHILLCRSAQLFEQQADTQPTGSQGNNLAYRELIWKKGQCRMVSDW